MITGLTLLAAAIGLRGASGNRHVRGRLFGSALAFAVYAIARALLSYAPITPIFRQQIIDFSPLLLAFGLLNAFVAMAVNPWKEDRLPDRFPTIVQDTLVIALFAVVATIVLQEKIIATTAVGAVVVGFALQDTLGNLFAGLAIQIEKPFRVGHWIHIGGVDGIVVEVTWRATKIRTKAGNFVVVPNSTLSKDTITNYSEPHPLTRLEVEVGVSYNDEPEAVKAAILEVLEHEPMISHERKPDVIITQFGDSAITYRTRVWTDDYTLDDRVKDRVATLIFHAFQRRGITIPYPIQWYLQRSEDPYARPRDDGSALRALEAVEIFASLDPDTRDQLQHAAAPVHYAAGETIVRQGQPGSSMFVIVRGQAKVTIDPDGREVARFDGRGFFGEMSLLTGEPRTATVAAVTPCDFLEITADAFRRFVLAHPACVELIGLATAERATQIARARSAGVAAPPAVEGPTLISRIRRFLGVG